MALDKKQIIHIASEVVVLLGVTFYFSAQNKKLTRCIEELAQRLETQEDTIQKLQVGLRTAFREIGSLKEKQEEERSVVGRQTQSRPQQVFFQRNKRRRTQSARRPRVHRTPIMDPPKTEESTPRVHFSESPQFSPLTIAEEDDEEELDEEDESVLDAEISAELEELDEVRLKKQELEENDAEEEEEQTFSSAIPAGSAGSAEE